MLSRAEVRALLSQLEGAPWLVASLLYGRGLRVMEALRIRVKDLVLECGELLVREAKGGKDRVTMLPAALDAPLRAHLARLRSWYEDERRRQQPGAHCSWPWRGIPSVQYTNGAGNIFSPVLRALSRSLFGVGGAAPLHEKIIQRAVQGGVRNPLDRGTAGPAAR